MTSWKLRSSHRNWEDWLGIFLGIVIVLAPWIAEETANSSAVINAAVAGLFVMILAEADLVDFSPLYWSKSGGVRGLGRSLSAHFWLWWQRVTSHLESRYGCGRRASRPLGVEADQMNDLADRLILVEHSYRSCATQRLSSRGGENSFTFFLLTLAHAPQKTASPRSGRQK